MPELRGSGADLVKRNLRKLPRVAAPLEVRKLALYDLANALANVDAPHERAVVEACASGEMVGQLAALLIDIFTIIDQKVDTKTLRHLLAPLMHH